MYIEQNINFSRRLHWPSTDIKIYFTSYYVIFFYIDILFPLTNMSNTACVFLETGTDYPSRAPGFMTRILVSLRSVSSATCCTCLWIVNSLLTFRFSLTLIYSVDLNLQNQLANKIIDSLYILNHFLHRQNTKFPWKKSEMKVQNSSYCNALMLFIRKNSIRTITIFRQTWQSLTIKSWKMSLCNDTWMMKI